MAAADWGFWGYTPTHNSEKYDRFIYRNPEKNLYVEVWKTLTYIYLHDPDIHVPHNPDIVLGYATNNDLFFPEKRISIETKTYVEGKHTFIVIRDSENREIHAAIIFGYVKDYTIKDKNTFYKWLKTINRSVTNLNTVFENLQK